MVFLEWKREIASRLMKIGFDKEYANSKANSVRGCYYSGQQFPDPAVIVKAIMQRCSIGLLSDDQLKAYKKEYKDIAI